MKHLLRIRLAVITNRVYDCANFHCELDCWNATKDSITREICSIFYFFPAFLNRSFRNIVLESYYRSQTNGTEGDRLKRYDAYKSDYLGVNPYVIE